MGSSVNVTGLLPGTVYDFSVTNQYEAGTATSSTTRQITGANKLTDWLNSGSIIIAL